MEASIFRAFSSAATQLRLAEREGTDVVLIQRMLDMSLRERIEHGERRANAGVQMI